MEPKTEAPYGNPIVLSEGPFQGWTSWGAGADPFETAMGPFCFRAEGEHIRCAFQPRREHLNGAGAIHGGALMSFADFSLFAIAYNVLTDVKAVTLTCNCEFLSAGGLGPWVEARGEVLQQTRSLVFVRGILTQDDRALLAFSGTLKKMTPR
jgi:uncharacterized protein (TIGR00369 family)